MSPDEAALRAAAAAWHKASEMADPAVTAPLLAPDAVLLAPGRAPVAGRDACAAFLSPRPLGIRVRIDIARAETYGDGGHVWCEVLLSLPASPDVPEVRVEGHVLSLFRKDAKGKWLLAREATLLAPARP